ncbi:hypothetical protein DUI87_02879 [Hirundo rustica rustica]|uniref:Peptidase A2 domain-containing protein n=1 Tax=Hirundo rustica rustica TaxID=333673 RepID=A0A3M0L9E2_HIRRU|nr:hypothetical protein DUI87_02879 [Hirundo rustica rustica]
MEQGIRCLRELAVLEIIFSEDERFPKSPDDVQCTSQMWLRFARLGPEMYSRYLATLQWREGKYKVGILVNKLRIYEDTVTAPFRTHVSSVETRLAEQVRSLIEEGHQKLKKELKEEIYHISPEPTRVSAIRSRYPPARERGYTPRGNLWSFLWEHGEDMRKWDRKPTSSLAARVEERDNRIYWTVWIRWPGTSDPQKYTALVDTGAQCTLMPSRYVGTESISISGVTGGSQQLTLLEAEVNLTGNGWQKHPIVTGPEVPCILGIDYLRNGYFKDPKGYCWAFGIAAVETEDIRQLNTLPALSDDSSAVGLLRVEEQQVPIATTTVHRRQYRTDRDSVIPIHEMICKLESQGVVSKAHSPFNSPIWPVCKSSGE